MVATAVRTVGVQEFATAEDSVDSPASRRERGQPAEAFASFGNRVDVRPRVGVRQVSAIVIVAAACWLVVFTAGYAMLG